MRWDPQRYEQFHGYRGRPFADLLARVEVAAPRRIVDAGCGTGALTATLAQRWPRAAVEGFDSSPEMIEEAGRVPGAVTFAIGDVTTWQPLEVDLLVSNAVLQWVPDHLEVLGRWAAAVPAGGALAVQVPGNMDAPAHATLRALAASPRWAPEIGDVLLRPDAVATPTVYAELLADHGLVPDVWETTYLQLMPGSDAVLDWMRGTGLRPVLAALEPAQAAAFEADYAAALRAAYPAGRHGTPYPFRRVFAVAHRAD